jgi:C4-dicarboxylate-specific signal transduction histidine kinase
VKREPVEILALIQEIAANWQAQNPARKLMTSFSISTPALTFSLDEIHIRQIIANLLTCTAIQVDEAGQVTLTSGEDDQGLHLNIQSRGKKIRADLKMDTTMLTFISRSLLELNGARLDAWQVDEDGANASLTFLHP